MNTRTLTLAALSVATLYLPQTQAAQLGDVLNSASGLKSVASSSSGNVAGVLEYCVKHNYLNADGATAVKNALIDKLPGKSASSDSGYSDGANGILTGSGGQRIDLSGSALKDKATKQVCNSVLSQGKSLL